MEKLGSEFLDDFIKEDKPIIFQLTARGLVLVLGVITSIVLITVLFFYGYPDVLVVAVAVALLVPTVIYGLGFDKKFSLRERFYFMVLIKRRIYQTELNTRKEYTIGDFLQEKTVRETDPIGTSEG